MTPATVGVLFLVVQAVGAELSDNNVRVLDFFYDSCDIGSGQRIQWDGDIIRSCNDPGVTCNGDIVEVDLSSNGMSCTWLEHPFLVMEDMRCNLSHNSITDIEWLIRSLVTTHNSSMDLSYNSITEVTYDIKPADFIISHNPLSVVTGDMQLTRSFVALDTAITTFSVNDMNAMQELHVSHSLVDIDLTKLNPELIVSLTIRDSALNRNIADFDELEALENLDLSNSGITGSLQSVSSLTNLQSLSLSGNLITGDFSNVRSAHPMLLHLDVSDNFLTGNLDDLHGSSLSYLDVNNNNLDGIFENAGSIWSGLKHLDVGSNNLPYATYPTELSFLTGLEYISIRDNNFVSLEGFTSGSNLTNLRLDGNSFAAIPENLRSSSIESLDLSRNSFATFPIAVLSMPRLTNLAIREALFSDLPNLRSIKLTTLDISRNLWGAVPFSLLPRTLTYLDASHMGLEGTLMISPDDVPPNLETLILSDNALSGEVPSELEELNLRRLSLQGNTKLFCPVSDYSSFAAETDHAWFLGSDGKYDGDRCTCPMGYFIENERCNECDEGFFGDEENCVGKQTCCEECPAGKLCASGTGNPPPPCPFGSYCEAGTSTGQSCPNGRWTLTSGSDDIADCVDLRIVENSLLIDGNRQSVAQSTAGGQNISLELYTTQNGISLTGQYVFFGPDENPRAFLCEISSGSSSALMANIALEVECTLGEGYGMTKPTVLLLHGSTEIQLRGSDELAYPSPVIDPGTLRVDDGDPTEDLVATDPDLNDVVYFDGENFGAFDAVTGTDNIEVEMGVNVGNAFQPKYTCDVITANHTTIACAVPPTGEGGLYRFRVSITGAEDSAVGTDTYSFQAVPVVESISSCSGGDACPTMGDERVDFSGEGFPFNNGIVMTVTVGGRTCDEIIIESPTTGSCVLPEGTGVDVAVVASHSGLFSEPRNLVAYARPTVTGVTGCDRVDDVEIGNCPREGGVVITVTGDNFGGTGALVFVGEQRATPDTQTHQQLTFTLPAGTQLGRPLLVVQSSGSISDVSGTVSYRECGLGTYQDGVICADCPAGTYSDELNALTCKVCQDGTFSSGTGNDVCTSCNAGEYSSGTEGDPPTECFACEAGRFSTIDTLRTGECAQCPPGQYQNETGQTSCMDCPGGQFQLLAGQPLCLDCGEGNRSTSTTSCERCPAGTYGPISRNAECLDCPAGQIQGNTGATACESCPEGFSPDSGSRTCALCRSGTYSPLDTEGLCLDCDPGHFSEFGNVTSCAECPVGFFQARPGAARCEPCPPGYESRTNASSACTSCLPGWANAGSGKECDMCEPGTFASGFNHTICDPCPPGTFASGAGATRCELCPVNYFANDAGSTSCTQCGAGTFQREEGQRSCSSCDAGDYLDGGGICQRCPDTAQCFVSDPSSSSGVAVGLVASRVGFWTSRGVDGEIHSLPCRLGQCVDASACSETFAVEAEVTPVRNCCGENRRLPAHENPLCGTCADGFYEWGSSCIECSDNAPWILFGLVLVGELYVILFHLVSQFRGGATHIFMYFIQMVGLFLVSPWLEWLSIFNFNVFEVGGGAACPMRRSPIEKLQMGLFLPFVSVALLLLTFCLHYAYVKLRARRQPANRARVSSNESDLKIAEPLEDTDEESERSPIQKVKDSYLRTMCGLFLWSFNSISRATLEFFDCTNVELSTGTVSVLTAQPSIDCNSDEYQALVPLYIIFFILVVGAPLVVLLLMWRQFKNNSLFRYENVNRFGLMFERYKRSRYWYEPYVLYRRVALISISVWAPDDRLLMFQLFSGLNLLILLIHLLVRPFEKDHENFLETGSLAILTIFTVALSSSTIPLSTTQNITFSVTVFAVMFLFGCYFAYEHKKTARAAQKVLTHQASRVLSRMRSTRGISVEQDATDSSKRPKLTSRVSSASLTPIDTPDSPHAAGNGSTAEMATPKKRQSIFLHKDNTTHFPSPRHRYSMSPRRPHKQADDLDSLDRSPPLSPSISGTNKRDRTNFALPHSSSQKFPPRPQIEAPTVTLARRARSPQVTPIRTAEEHPQCFGDPPGMCLSETPTADAPPVPRRRTISDSRTIASRVDAEAFDTPPKVPVAAKTLIQRLDTTVTTSSNDDSGGDLSDVTSTTPIAQVV